MAKAREPSPGEPSSRGTKLPGEPSLNDPGLGPPVVAATSADPKTRPQDADPKTDPKTPDPKTPDPKTPFDMVQGRQGAIADRSPRAKDAPTRRKTDPDGKGHPGRTYLSSMHCLNDETEEGRQMRAFIRRFFLHYGINRNYAVNRYPLRPLAAARNAWRVAR